MDQYSISKIMVNNLIKIKVVGNARLVCRSWNRYVEFVVNQMFRRPTPCEPVTQNDDVTEDPDKPQKDMGTDLPSNTRPNKNDEIVQNDHRKEQEDEKKCQKAQKSQKVQKVQKEKNEKEEKEKNEFLKRLYLIQQFSQVLSSDFVVDDLTTLYDDDDDGITLSEMGWLPPITLRTNKKRHGILDRQRPYTSTSIRDMELCFPMDASIFFHYMDKMFVKFSALFGAITLPNSSKKRFDVDHDVSTTTIKKCDVDDVNDYDGSSLIDALFRDLYGFEMTDQQQKDIVRLVLSVAVGNRLRIQKFLLGREAFCERMDQEQEKKRNNLQQPEELEEEELKKPEKKEKKEKKEKMEKMENPECDLSESKKCGDPVIESEGFENMLIKTRFGTLSLDEEGMTKIDDVPKKVDLHFIKVATLILGSAVCALCREQPGWSFICAVDDMPPGSNQPVLRRHIPLRWPRFFPFFPFFLFSHFILK